MKRRKVVAVAIATPIVLVVAVLIVPPMVLRDALAPASLAPYVEAARADLRSHSIEGPLFWWPVHFQFVDARCSSTYPGRVALIFEAWRPPYLSKSYGVAWRGSFPTSFDDGWGGGIGMGSVYDDDEFVYQMGENTVSCP